MTLTSGMPAILDAKDGEALFVVRGGDGSLPVMAHDAELAAFLEAAEVVMDENRKALAGLP